MSFNGSGTFVVNSAGQPVVTGTTITSTAFNLLTADLATGLTTTLTKDGQSTPTANIPMGSFKLTGLANGTAAADAVRMSQLQSNGANYITVAGTADVITGGITPALTAYAAGNEFVFVVGSTNTTSVTLNVDGLGAKAITKDGTGALTAGDLTAGDVALIVYDGTRFQLVSASYGVSSWAGGTTGLTPASATTGAVSLAGTLVVANGGTGAATLTANNVLLGNGTSAVQVVAPGTSGNLLTSNGTTWSSTAPAASGVTTFTAGTTGLTPSSPTAGAVTLSGTLAVANGGTGGTTSTGTGAVVLATNPALVGYTVNTASGVDGEWTTAGLTVYANAVTPQHDGPLHVMSGTAGTWSPNTSADEFIVESSGSGGISIGVPDASTAFLMFSSPTVTTSYGALLQYQYSTGVFIMENLKAGGTLLFRPASGSSRGEWDNTGLTCFASGVTPQHDGVLHVMGSSAGAVTGTGQLIVEQSGAPTVCLVTTDAGYGRLTWASPTLAANSIFVEGGYNGGNNYIQFSANVTNYSPFQFLNSATTNPRGMLMTFGGSPDNNTQTFFVFQDSTTIRCQIMSDGDLQNHDNSYGAISDRRLKQDIVPSGTQWDDVKALGQAVKKYRFISDVEADKEHVQIGLIAQDVLGISPGLVSHDEDNDTYTVQYSVANVKMLKALSEAMERIEALETHLAAVSTIH